MDFRPRLEQTAVYPKCQLALSDNLDRSIISRALKLWPRRRIATSSLRIGLGEDSHRLADGGPLRLGGIDIPHDRHAEGHSDADVLLHAVTDALLGAAGQPDIGELFPNTAEENCGRDSAEMLRLAYGHVRAAGYGIVNLDCVISAERPKLSPYKQAIREQLAAILATTIDRVNVKAKTGEGVGPVGEQTIVQVHCVALLEKI